MRNKDIDKILDTFPIVEPSDKLKQRVNESISNLKVSNYQQAHFNKRSVWLSAVGLSFVAALVLFVFVSTSDQDNLDCVTILSTRPAQVFNVASQTVDVFQDNCQFQQHLNLEINN